MGAHGAEGERRQATVVFSDVVGFTAICEQLDPEDVQSFMRRLKDGAVSIVEAHGGIVSQFVGDTVLALFGVPTAHEDDPVRAVRAVQELGEMAQQLSRGLEPAISRGLQLHTGISTGLVVTSTADARDGTVGVTGDTVNLAARLMAAAPADSILLSEDTQKLVAPFYRTEALEPISVKGKAAAQAAYRVLRRRDIATRFEAAASVGLTPLAGREVEFSKLVAALDKAIAGEGQFVSVIGEPGIGKSRLAHELKHTARQRDVMILEGRCQAYGTDTPYLPFLDALRRGLRLNEADSVESLHREAVENILAVDPALAKYLPHLLKLLSIPSQEHPLPASLNTDELRRESEEALIAATTQCASRWPTLLVLEDWHWVDEPSDAVIQRLSSIVGHHPLMLVVLYRPDYRRSWGELEHYTALVLKSLDEVSTGEIIRSVIHAKTLPAGLAERVHQRTAGNALFIEEIARALVDEGRVTVSRGRAALNGSLEQLHLPETVHAVIRARVDRLEPVARELLCLMSVIGRDVDGAVLLSLSPSKAQMERALTVLRDQDLVHQVRVLPQPLYRFKHVLSQEVVYETLLHSQRRKLQADVAAAIETIYANRLEEHVEELARHFSQSNEHEKAVHYLLRAADKAMSTYSYVEAGAHYETASAILERMEQSAEVRARRVDVTTKWGSSLIGTPNPRVAAAMADAIELCRGMQAPAALTRLLAICGWVEVYLGESAQGFTHLEEGLRLARSLDDTRQTARLLALTGNAHWCVAAYGAAVEHAEAGLALIRESSNPTAESLANGYLGIIYACAGDFASSDRHTDAATTLGSRIGNLGCIVLAKLGRSVAEVGRGNWPVARAMFDDFLSTATEMGYTWQAAWGRFHLGNTEYHLGNKRHGIALMESSVSMLEPFGSSAALPYLPDGYGYLAYVCAREGRDEEARRWIADLNELPPVPARGHIYRCWARAELGCRGGGEDPVEVLGEGMGLADQLGARGDLALTRMLLAEALHRRNDRAAAERTLGEAETLMSELGMSGWLAVAGELRKQIEQR